MPSYKAKAVILKSYKLGESDRIIKMYSQQDGIISAVAKGARKTRSKFGGRLELFNIVDLEISTGKSLDIITQAEILKSFKNISSDFYKFVFCEMISEIVLKTQHSGGSSEMLFKLIYVCFNEIDGFDNEDIISLKKAVCFFGAKSIKIIGYRPLLKNCCKCGVDMKDLYSFRSRNIPFSIKFGGILCGRCSEFLEGTVKLDVSAYRFLCDLFNLKIEDFRDMEVNLQVLKKIRSLMENYITYHIDCNIKSFKYLKKVGI